MADCDEQIAEHMGALDDQDAGPPPPSNKKGNKAPDEPMRQHLFAKFGLDLTAVEGVSIQTVLAFMSEVGTDVGRFATAEHFGSWLGLCPDNRITDGRTLAPRQSHHRRAHPRGSHPQGQQPPRHGAAHGRPVISSIEILFG
jgi:hypothetical protein